MNILVDNSGYGLCNVGDKAMLQIGLRRLRALFPDATLEVICVRASDLSELDPSAQPVSAQGRSQFLLNGSILGAPLARRTGWETTLRVEHPRLAMALVRGRKKLKGASTPAMNEFLEAFARADAVVSTGGGFLNDTFKGHARMVVELLAMAARAGKATAMFGQGLGPVTDAPFRAFLAQHLPRLDLFTLREEVGARALLEELMPATRVLVTGDDAIDLAFEARPAALGTALGVNVRVAHYSQVDEAAALSLGQTLREFASARAVSLVPVPISHCGDGADAPAIASVLGEGEGGAHFKTSLSVIEEVGKCRVVVTGSYHAGVFALSQGVGVVALSNSLYYDAKFQGLRAQFGAGERVVRPTDLASLSAILGEAWTHAPAERATLLESARVQRDASRAAYERFKALVETRAAKTAA